MVPKTPRVKVTRLARALERAGFEMTRSAGSHRMYVRGDTRIVLPYHAGEVAHPKKVREVMELAGLTPDDL